MAAESLLEGGCLCGAIRYRVGELPEHRMVCHCESCRRASGAPVVAWVTFPTDGFQILRGELAHYVSSPGVTRGFCSSCGTPLTYHRADMGEFIDVTTCSFDDPSALAPTHHSWVEDSVSWVEFADGLPAYRRTRREG